MKEHSIRLVGLLALSVSMLLIPQALWAQVGNLETPAPGSFQSGIGLVRGWVCTAKRVDIEIVGIGSLPAVYGQSRGDTRSVCNGKIDNGFSLIANWNELGEGTHTVRALADGVEFDRAQVVVATLGQKYLRGAQGDFIVSPFPQEGKQVRLRWLEGRQAFVFTNGGAPASGGSNPRNDARLEDPSPGSFQSGIGVVRGWVCNASRIDVEIDGKPFLPAAYGELRADTRSACNNKDNNGFSLQVNWNNVVDGPHTIRVLADGVLVGEATFTVVSLGLGEFPQGLKGEFLLTNFPEIGVSTEIQWQESQQNFVITGARFPGVPTSLCLPLSGEAFDDRGNSAQVTVTNPCLLSGNVAVLYLNGVRRVVLPQETGGREQRAANGDGFFLCSSNLTIQQAGKTFGPGSFRLVDFSGNEVCRELLPGATLDVLLQAVARTDLNFNAPFTLIYTNRVVIEIPPPIVTLAVSPEEVVFSSNVVVGAREDKTFTVTNTGATPLIGGMTLIATDSGGNSFSLVSDDSINLGAGQSQTVTVRYSPQNTSPVTGSVRITTNGGTKSVEVTGDALNGPPPSLLPAVNSISPSTGLTLGGTLVTIKGTNFDKVTNATIGGVPLANLMVLDTATIMGNSPPGAAGPVDVIVTAPTGSATLSNGFLYQGGISAQGSALSFDGINDLVTFGTVSRLSQHTIEAWVKPTSSAYGIIVAQDAGPGSACGFGTYVAGSGEELCYVLDQAGCGTGTSFCQTINTLGAWTHIAGTFDGDTARFYVNGALVREQSGASFAPSTWMTAGAVTFFNGQQFPFSGEIDEIRIWNFPRSMQEIQGTMHRPLTGTEPGLVGYWRMDEGSGQFVRDSSAAGITGVLGTTANPQSNDPAWVTSQAPIFTLQ